MGSRPWNNSVDCWLVSSLLCGIYQCYAPNFFFYRYAATGKICVHFSFLMMSEFHDSSAWASLPLEEYRTLTEQEMRVVCREHSNTTPAAFEIFLRHGGLVAKYGPGVLTPKQMKEQQAAANKYMLITAHHIAKCEEAKNIHTKERAFHTALRLKALGVPLLEIKQKTGIGGRQVLRAQERIDKAKSAVGKVGCPDTLLPVTVINAVMAKAKKNEQGNTGWTFVTFLQTLREVWRVEQFGPMPAEKTLRKLMNASWPANTNTKLVSTDARKEAHADILTSLNWASFLQYVKERHLANLRDLRKLAGLPPLLKKDEYVNSKLFGNVDTTSFQTYGHATVNKQEEEVHTTLQHKMNAAAARLSIVKPKMNGN